MKFRKVSADKAQRQPAATLGTPSSAHAAQPKAATRPGAPQVDIDVSARVLAQRRAVKAALGDTAQRHEDPLEDDELVQARAAPVNQTGMPNQLKAGIEALSGMDMSEVRVHRDSGKPAQLNALAYAQGNDIHLAPGQEQHLPHEAWHVVQQRQGRVKETTQLAGVGINDDAGLEREADVMGATAATQAPRPVAQRQVRPLADPGTAALAPRADGVADVAQRVIKPVEFSSIAPFVEAMRSRASGGTSAMVEDFAKIKPGCLYFVATNDKEGSEARYGLMSLRLAPPEIVDKGAARSNDPDHAKGTVWVEGVVADAGSGLGAILLDHAETVAQSRKCNLSLAAMEETFGDKPYSMAGYYAKRGMQYSGDALVEEAEEARKVYHPIYYKHVSPAKL